ncbi:hypothetical protein QQF64_002344 [Cirrhinus molitorella]|uniref:BED-type domain-containing protein n=1 Tax=Cirrhinus molitorella TaxID=172907 RepID=A0ABR3MPV7_9TELE
MRTPASQGDGALTTVSLTGTSTKPLRDYSYLRLNPHQMNLSHNICEPENEMLHHPDLKQSCEIVHVGGGIVISEDDFVFGDTPIQTLDRLRSNLVKGKHRETQREDGKKKTTKEDRKINENRIVILVRLKLVSRSRPAAKRPRLLSRMLILLAVKPQPQRPPSVLPKLADLPISTILFAGGAVRVNRGKVAEAAASEEHKLTNNNREEAQKKEKREEWRKIMKNKLKGPPASFHSKVWRHFRFYETVDEKALDKDYAICKNCFAKIKYNSNTTNLQMHLVRYHGKLLSGDNEGKPSQPTIITAFKAKLPFGSPRAQSITKSIGEFICKDLRPLQRLRE